MRTTQAQRHHRIPRTATTMATDPQLDPLRRLRSQTGMETAAEKKGRAVRAPRPRAPSSIPSAERMSVTVPLPSGFVEAVAVRVAELLGERSREDGFLDVAGAAAFLSCPKSRLYSLVSAGRIPHHKDGSRLLFDRDELRAYVRQGGARRP